jgi:hypothetical protein
MAFQAVMTGIAGDVVGGGDPISNFVLLHSFPHGDDLPGDLMAQDKGYPVGTIPFHKITAADATCIHTHQ